MDELKKTGAQDLIEVTVSGDGMSAFIKLLRNEADQAVEFTKEDLLAALTKEHVCFGIDAEIIEKLNKRPLYNLKIKVASGNPQKDGIDGTYQCLIKREDEFRPVFDDEEKIDYKNISCFQIVAKDQILCTIEKETAGIEGKDVFGQAVTAKAGRKPRIKEGKNTYFTEDGKELRASCEGIVKYIGHLVNVNNILHIKSNVDINTGNVDFPGDVTIDGDVCSGYQVKTRGNLVIKGVVEEANIEAGGNVHVASGINSGRLKKIKVGKILRSKYIESSVVEVGGDIFVDYIIDSLVTCKGNIKLSGQQELILGGQTDLAGELSAKDLGSDREYPTIIRIQGLPLIDEDILKEKTDQIEAIKKELEKISDSENSLAQSILKQKKLKKRDEKVLKKIAIICEELQDQKKILLEKLDDSNKDLENFHKNAPLEFYGGISCKRKLYRGVKIVFGSEIFHFDSDSLEHCRLYWNKGEIIQGML